MVHIFLFDNNAIDEHIPVCSCLLIFRVFHRLGWSLAYCVADNGLDFKKLSHTSLTHRHAAASVRYEKDKAEYILTDQEP